jgi:hypothetical protein
MNNFPVLSDKTKRDLVLECPFVLIPSIALTAPADVLDRFSYLKDVTVALEGVFPFIDGYASLSAFPQVTSLTLSMAMIFSGILLPIFLCFQLRIQDFKKFNEVKGMRNWGFLAGLLALIPFYMGGPVPGQSHRSLPIDLLICEYRVALAGFGSLLTMFEVMFLAFPVVWGRSLFLRWKI